MTGRQRLLIILAAVVVLVVVLVIVSPGGGGDDSASTTTAAPAATTPAPAATTPAATTPTTTAETGGAKPETATIQVRGGKPVGGVQSISAKKGERIRIKVTSPDTTQEVHLHGYDIKRDLEAGGSVEFSFTANVEGIFEMELEDTATQIAKLTIEPS